MKKYVVSFVIPFIILFLFQQKAAGQSSIFTDDFSDATLWTSVGTGVGVASNSGNFNFARCGADNHCYRTLTEPCSGNNVALNSGSWTATFTFTPTNINFGGVAHFIFYASSTYSDISATPPCNAIGVELISTLNNPSGAAFKIYSKQSYGSWVSTDSIPCSLNTTYYFKLVKDGGVVYLDSYNSNYSSVLNSISSSVSSNISNLSYIGFGVSSNGGTSRALWGSIDNLKIDGLDVPGFDKKFYYTSDEFWFDWLNYVYVPGDRLSTNYGTCFFNNAADGAPNRRAIVDYFFNNYCWETDFEFRPTWVNSYGGPGHMLIALTSNTDDPFTSPLPSQDAATVIWTGTLGGLPSTYQVKIQCRDAAGSWISSSPISLSTLNKTYYMTFKRTSSSQFYLDIYNDVCRTDTFGSTSLNIGNVSINSLSEIQHGCITAGSYHRSISATVDNLFINNNSCSKNMEIPIYLTGNQSNNEIAPVIYPNPGDGIFNIRLKGNTVPKESYLEIFNTVGVLVYETKWQDKNLIQLDLKELGRGVYFVKINCDNTIYSDKIIIQ